MFGFFKVRVVFYLVKEGRWLRSRCLILCIGINKFNWFVRDKLDNNINYFGVILNYCRIIFF